MSARRSNPAPGFEYLCYAPELLTSEFASQLIEQQSARGVPCLAVTADVFADLAEKDNPPGILAVVQQPGLAWSS